MAFFKGTTKEKEENKEPIPAEEDAILERVALKVVQWRMAVPAILFLESVKPLNYIGAQTMVFFEPIVQSIFNFKDYEIFRATMERRENVENLLQKIEKYDAVMYERERAIKKFMKGEKKKWKWYQRYCGIARPKVVLPEELRISPISAKDKK
ncbi:MAG: hypothetical protein NT002_08725 [candidate division Zixibacteria bacterium]|nr:hypothetical protein [candidate division Zixibacteria bacterium]